MAFIRLAILRGLLTTFLAAAAFTATAQSEVDIEKLTNGQDAGTAPGPAVIAGSTVNWSYVVTNTGSRPLANIAVTDDQGVTVTCPGTTLDAGLSFTCTASGTATLGQYTNIGTVTATLPDTTIVNDSDPSHYFGQTALSVAIEKQTNGVDADTAPGPSLPAGSTVNWTYEITNIGSDPLSDIIVTDDQGVTVTCPGITLAAGESMTCTASGTAQTGQYANIGTVTATLPSEEGVAASDPSHYYGQTLLFVKRTNGIESNSPPGPTLVLGATVTWTYEVRNPGPEPVSGLTVTDDQGVTVTCPQSTLAVNEIVICTASGTAQSGQYSNVGTATATLPLGGTVTASATSFYFGNAIEIRKSTNGADADVAPGPAIAPGDPVNWTYVVTNHGPDTLTGVTVTDDQGVTVTCPSTTLADGASMTCTAADVATAGQYVNVGTVEATSATLGALSASDPSHYFGQATLLDFGDAPDPTYPSLFASNGARHVLGGAVFLGNCVDSEADALAGAAANGDDTNSGTTFGTCTVAGDDEDGVTFTTPVRIGLSASIDVVASAPCTLSAWIDFNADGDWGDANESLFPGGTALAAGTNSRSFTVPASATPGTTFARFRCTTSGVVSFTGEAIDGEVEDYAVEIVVPLPAVSATKVDALLIDGDNDGFTEPGDTLRYTIVVTNSGAGDATGVAFSDTPDGNTALVVGSVTTSAGVVTMGNSAGNTSAGINIGTLLAGASATIAFDVVLDDPLASGVTTVSNQGTVSGTNFVNVLTDDPSVGGSADPTVTPVTLTPIVAATKTAALQTDANGNDIAEPGDVLRYTITLSNTGTGDALAVVFNDTPDARTTLVVGSVTTSQGTVTSGNTAGDTSVAVNAGTILPGAAVTIVFDVRVNALPPGVTMVVNFGTFAGSNIAGGVTDDPSLPGAADATPFTAQAALSDVPAIDIRAVMALIAMLAILAARKLA
ncbi:MAG TPA: GEVED domain-containing protein [Thermoanaerobaculia bacterium]|nr:GEVED domain-containing protein [Thermoanaerobaculia bacterium]